MNRRRVLTGLAAAGVLLGVGRFTSSAWVRSAAAGAGHQLLGVLRRPSSAAAVGRAFLAAYPGERDAERLADQITARIGGACRIPIETRHLRQALSREIRQDFANSRVVSVEGWILSETEARLCGLAALLAT